MDTPSVVFFSWPLTRWNPPIRTLRFFAYSCIAVAGGQLKDREEEYINETAWLLGPLGSAILPVEACR